jgi:multidrug efflux system outer membrane protein
MDNRKRRMRGFCLCASALLALNGCLLKPDYSRPEVLTDAPFLGQPVTQETIADLPWWEVFQDPNLQALIRVALAENRDLKVALARIDESRAILGVVRPDQFPRMDIGADAIRLDRSNASLFPMSPTNDYDLLGQLSFEVDVWGRYASATEAQRAELLSSEYAFRAITISLVSQVAASYVQLQNVDRQIAISKRTLDNRHAATVLNQQRFNGGYVGLLDVNQAQIQEEDARAALIALERQRRLTENALSVLLGDIPHPIVRSDMNKNPLTLIKLPVGVPAMLLERRPDVRAAEEQARAAVMRIGIARAQQYPSLSLTGFLGLNAARDQNLFSADAQTWSIGAGLFGPLIDLGKSWSRTDAAEAQARQALETYENTVLQAVKDVEDARISVDTFRQEHAARAAQVKAGKSGSMLSRRRYMDGVTSYLEVLETERSLFQAELAHSGAQERFLFSIIQLYRSLGGGWLAEPGR